jgi:uncharacterized protein
MRSNIASSHGGKIVMPVISLFFGAAALLFNLWLGIRCGQVRTSAKISHGDGGNPLLQRRMRAHLNFAEYTPTILFLFLALELAGTSALFLQGIAIVYIVARICHALGMDPDESKLRMLGIMATMLVGIALAGHAVYTGYHLLSVEAAVPEFVSR